jgi:hypothetical protein
VHDRLEGHEREEGQWAGGGREGRRREGWLKGRGGRRARRWMGEGGRGGEGAAELVEPVVPDAEMSG